MSLAAVAGGLALASYLDAKYHLKRDGKTVWKLLKHRKTFEAAVKNKRASLWYKLAETCKAYPNLTAIWSRDGVYTYAEVHDRTVQYAQWLLSEGVQPRDLVAMYMTNRPEFMMVWMALLCIGAAPAFINYNLEGSALVHCLKVADAKLLIVDKEHGCPERINGSREEIEKTSKIVVLDDSLQSMVTSRPVVVPENKYRDDVKGDDMCCLIYTSGTTGLPKGAPFSTARVHLFGWDPPFDGVPGVDRVYNSMPLYHGTGGISSIVAMLTGLTVSIGRKFSASGFFPDIVDSQSTVFIYVGETVRYLLNMPPHPLERKHKLRVAYGNGLRPDVWQKFQDRFNVPEVHEFFNSSEGMFVLISRAKGPYLRASVGHHGLIYRFLLRNIYIPVKIDHETGDIWRDPQTGFAERMPYEEGGEILVAILPTNPPADFKGYWKSPEATNKKFARDVFKKGDLFYRTGDALRRTTDGHWHFMDRLGDTYRWKSENVSTAEVAEALGTFPGIAEANVYGVEVPNHEGRAGCAAIHITPSSSASASASSEKDPESQIDFAALLAYTRTHLPRYAVPTFLRIVRQTSHIHNNKQNKVLLRKEGIDPDRLGQEDENGKDDIVLWLKPSSSSPATSNNKSVGTSEKEKERWTRFKREDWEKLQGGKARL